MCCRYDGNYEHFKKLIPESRANVTEEPLLKYHDHCFRLIKGACAAEVANYTPASYTGEDDLLDDIPLSDSDSNDGDGVTVTFKDYHGTDELDLAEMGDLPGGEDSD